MCFRIAPGAGTGRVAMRTDAVLLAAVPTSTLEASGIAAPMQAAAVAPGVVATAEVAVAGGAHRDMATEGHLPVQKALQGLLHLRGALPPCSPLQPFLTWPLYHRLLT